MVWNHQELKALEKYTSYDLAQKLRGVLEKQARGDQILIGNTGMVSSGKSSLFNALLGAVEEERFKTGAIPHELTVAIKNLDDQDGRPGAAHADRPSGRYAGH